MSDDAIRLQALDPARSILLQAPAGSGKTTVLAQRFLNLLAEVDEPEQLLAITFTRKAAAEMRERVLAALEDRLEAGGPVAVRWAEVRQRALRQARARGWSMAELGSRLRIQTIDSLNHEIVRTMPVLGRFQPSLQVVDDATALYHAAALDTMRRIDTDPALQADADVLLVRLDNNQQRAVGLLAGLLDARASWLPTIIGNGPQGLAPAITASLARIITASLRQLAALLPAPLLQEAQVLLRLAAQHRKDANHVRGRWAQWLDAATTLSPGAQQLEAWQAMAELALTKDLQLRRRIDARSGFPATDKPLKQRWQEWVEALAGHEDVVAGLARLALLPPPLLDDDDQAAVAALARVLFQAAGSLQLAFQEQRCVDHTEIALTALHALRADDGPTDLGIRHTLRIHHLLVDEFQDVSPLQVELVAALTAGWSRGDGRSLFLVGDPMQSIYLFRHSEVGLFLRTRQQGIGDIALEPLQLASNFRSLPQLVQWANETFAACFPRQEDMRSSAVTFLPSTPARDPGSVVTGAVQVCSLDGDDPAAEAVWVAERIGAAQAADPESDIAILLRHRALAPPLVAALREAGIGVRAVELASLAQHQTVIDLVALGSALLHGADHAAWLSVLRQPACGLLLPDLERLVQAGGGEPLVQVLADPARWAPLSQDGRGRLARVAPLLVTAWHERQRMPLADTIESLWRALGAEALADPMQRHVAAQYLAALRRQAVDDPALDAIALAALAARLRDTPPAATATRPRPVEILTIHHAKGLEWDHVFVPGLGKAPRTGNPALMRWLELPAAQDQHDLLLAVHSIGGDAEADALGSYIKLLQLERERNEDLRVAYVAFTRARRRLYLSGWARPDAKSGERSPRGGSLLHRLWPALAPKFATATPGVAAPEVASTAAAAANAPAYHRARAGFDPHARRLPLGAPGGLAVGDPGQATRPEFTWVGPRARAEGTLVHALLEAVARSGDWAVLDTPEMARRSRRQLRQLGLPGHEADLLAGDVLVRVQRLQEDDRARWLLDPHHGEAHCELRLSGVVEGRLRDIIIDRSFVDASGQRWVVDYKTSTHAGGDLAGFLANELARYRPQLLLYRQLAARLGPEPVRAALYFPWLRQWVELPYSQASENG